MYRLTASNIFSYTIKRNYKMSERFNSNKTVRIGCASGFWGDTATSVPQLVYNGKLNYLVFDYLAEITMSLLAAVKTKMPNMGYAPDFVHFAMKPFLSEIQKQGIKVISNAGGINPLACAEALRQVAKEQNIDLNIAVVTGDDLMEKKEQFEKLGIVDMKSGNSFPSSSISSMNAYLGCGGIVKALQNGADIVITGRCVDSAVTLGPLVHEFNWKMDAFDKLAAGSLAGHIIECGAQCTGGICTSWESVSGWDNMGFPIVEVNEDGVFTLTKPPKTGGAITVPNVTEQLLYEIDNPRSYKLPDVVCDFSNVTIKENGDNSVVLEGAKGRPPTNNYKVCATFKDGYRVIAVCPIIGPNAAEKAKRSSEAVLKRCRRIFNFLGLEDFRRTHIEVLGTGHNYGANATPSELATREAIMWCGAHHDEKRALELMGRELAASATGAAPGLTTMVGGRPKVSPVLRLFSFLLPKSQVKIQIHTNSNIEELQDEIFEEKVTEPVDDGTSSIILDGNNTYKLSDLAYTRSGDKGDSSNIGVISRDPKYYPYLKKHLTTKVVAKYFSHLFENPSTAEKNVTRYTLPGVHGLNFVLEEALGGGGVYSLRSDPQGKALGQILLDCELQNLPNLAEIK